jgi:hypothetical protein
MTEPEVKIPWHARMWPRAIFDAPSKKSGRKGKKIADDLPILKKGGVYILYRDDLPYYIGQATKFMSRLRTHSTPGGRYDLFWNYFSLFVLDTKSERDKIEAILITAFPTANGATPRIKRDPYDKDVKALVRMMRSRLTQPIMDTANDGAEEANDGTEE